MNQDKEQLFRDALLLLLASEERDGGKTSNRLYQELGARRCGWYFGIHDVYQLEGCLESCTKLFDVRANGRNDVSIIPKTSLAVCRNHSNKSGSCPGGTCPDLHFCKYFLLSGECCFGQRCLFGHDMRTPHNQSLLKRHLLWGLNFTDLRTLFCLPEVRQGVTVPQVCKFYNVMKGCTKGMDCHSLHLCLHYVQDHCKFANRCVRNHDINNPQVLKVLALFGVKVKGRKLSDILQEVRYYSQKHKAELDSDDEVYGYRHAPGAGARPKRSGSVPNLLRGLTMSTAPQHGAHPRAPSVDRRSRTSSESSFAHLAGAAPCKTEEICLYFLMGKCRFEGKCHRLHSDALNLCRVTSAEGRSEWRGLPPDSNRRLEEAYSQPQNKICSVTYMSDSESVLVSSGSSAEEDDDKDDEARAREGSFRQDFYGTDVQAHTRSDIPYNARGPGRRAEDTSRSAEFLNNVLSPIYNGSQTFMKIKRRFTTTLGVGCHVLGIFSVDNPLLKARYQRMKSAMASCRHVVERELYYAPSANEDTTSICTNGVDCERPPVLMNGISLGRGGHFHVNAAQANKSIQRNGERHVFVMKCLVGSGRGEDCIVDDIDNPRVYVISNPSMVCPLYVITYQLS